MNIPAHTLTPLFIDRIIFFLPWHLLLWPSLRDEGRRLTKFHRQPKHDVAAVIVMQPSKSLLKL